MVRVAGIQCSLTDDLKSNLDKVESYIVQAAKDGARVVLPSELFEGYYFCRTESEREFSRAHAVENHPFLPRFQKLAAEFKVVLPVSFFEKAGPAYFNSVGMIDADGRLLGVYRKSHIPDGPGYEEKYYFRPGDTGFRVWRTRYGTVGLGICWDQWFPECARSLALQGAEMLLYPTAIGSEPGQKDLLLTKDRWQRAMIGHSVCNVLPVLAPNRMGWEENQFFYGHSFATDAMGNVLTQLDEKTEGLVTAEWDLAAFAELRASWGFFRDRRPDLYGTLTGPFPVS